jgi:hypothetical protein
MDEEAVGIADVDHWREPGVHCVQMGSGLVWVRVDARGIAAMSSIGPEALAPCALLPTQRGAEAVESSRSGESSTS